MDDAAMFVCRQCGACCRRPGDVRLTDDDLDRAARLLGMTVRAFAERYTRLTSDRGALSFVDGEGDACVFLAADGTCRIHETKPNQCRDYPLLWRDPDWQRICAGAEQTTREQGKEAGV